MTRRLNLACQNFLLKYSLHVMLKIYPSLPKYLEEFSRKLMLNYRLNVVTRAAGILVLAT